MPFPESERVIYDRNPLAEVICQLRFPPILRIDSDLPAAFQDHIRGTFPVLAETPSVEPVTLPPNLPRQVADLLQQQLTTFKAMGAPPKSYTFSTEDLAWAVRLSRDALSLTTRRYRRWEEFIEFLQRPLEALQSEYDPAYFSRVGLRYRDLICRSDLDMDPSTAWSELLRPEIAAELVAAEVAADVKVANRQLLLQLPDEAQVHLQHGLGRKDLSDETGEECYVIDADYFTDSRTEVADAGQVLQGFNRQAGRVFRWCISDRLHLAMDPRPVVDEPDGAHV